MNTYLLLLLINVFTVNVISSQVTIENGEVTYQKKMIKTYSNDTTKDDLLFKGASSVSGLHSYSLIFNKNASKFIFHENLGLEISTKEKYYSKLSSLLCNDYNYYSDSENKIRVQDYDGILVSDDEKINWTITSESKTISGFLTYKATYSTSLINYKGEKKEILIIAWFTPIIPISYGPKRYNGLPGLILELEDAVSIIYATDVKLNGKEKVKIDIPKGKIISKEEYKKRVFSKKLIN
jgi:GLPGLI family protein